MRVVLIILLSVALAGCARTCPRTRNTAPLEPPFTIGTAGWPSVLETGMLREIRAAAMAAAHADIALGKPRIAFTGGIASWPIGISPEDFDLVKNLPRVSLPIGCTAPFLREAAIYAEAYNKEILPYLKNVHQPTH